VSAQPKHAAQPDEIVPADLRTYLRWDHRHDDAAADVMRNTGLRCRAIVRRSASSPSPAWCGASPSGYEPTRAFVFEQEEQT